MASKTASARPVVWQGADYPRIPPGEYQAICIGWQGPEWIRRYRRWSLRVEFCLIAEGQCVSAFYNMGSNKRGADTRPRSRFYALWCLANGERPRKGQQMDWDVLTESGLLYTVRVADVVRDENDDTKPDALVYSAVVDVLRVERK